MLKNIKHKKIINTVIIFIIFFLTLGTFFSMKYKTCNAFIVADAITKVTWTDTDYVVLRENPRVIIGKNDFSFRNYQLERGYMRIQARANGTFLIYSNGEHEEYIEYTKGNNYSTWMWKN